MARSSDALWLEYLTDEDTAFIKRFILASGSLKAVAEVYGVSYPTVRLRLDRLIQKIEVVESQSVQSHFERVLRARYAEGAIDLHTLKMLLRAHQRELEQQTESQSGVSNEKSSV